MGTSVSAILASVGLFALFILIAAPGVLALSRPGSRRIAVPLYLVLVVGLATYHAGVPFSGEASLPVAGGSSGQAPAGLCQQAIRQSEQAGLILNRANPERVVVSRSLWAQLPQQVKDGVVLCLQRPATDGAEAITVQIVEAGR